jgi:hypothetical protein
VYDEGFAYRSSVYRANPKAVASVVLAWPGWAFCVVRYVPSSTVKMAIKVRSSKYNSTVIMFMSQKHDDHFGAKSKYGQGV